MAGEDVDRVVIGVWPNSVFWIVGKIRAEIELIAMVAPRCIRTGGDRHALLALGEGAVVLQLADQPAAGEVIVEHDRISAVGRFELAGAAKARPKRVYGGGSHHSRPRSFVINRDRNVYHLHKLLAAGCSICIRGNKGETKYVTGILRALPFEVQSGCHTLQRSAELLGHSV